MLENTYLLKLIILFFLFITASAKSQDCNCDLPFGNLINYGVVVQGIDTNIVNLMSDTALTLTQNDKTLNGKYKYHQKTGRIVSKGHFYWYEMYSFYNRYGDGSVVLLYVEYQNIINVKYKLLDGSFTFESEWIQVE